MARQGRPQYPIRELTRAHVGEAVVGYSCNCGAKTKRSDGRRCSNALPRWHEVAAPSVAELRPYVEDAGAATAAGGVDVGQVAGG